MKKRKTANKELRAALREAFAKGMTAEQHPEPYVKAVEKLQGLLVFSGFASTLPRIARCEDGGLLLTYSESRMFCFDILQVIEKKGKITPQDFTLYGVKYNAKRNK